MRKTPMVVLCLNDFPLGVYTTTELADAAALSDWKKRELRWEEQGLAFKESMNGMGGAYKYVRYFYHQHEYEVDAPARL